MEHVLSSQEKIWNVALEATTEGFCIAKFQVVYAVIQTMSTITTTSKQRFPQFKPKPVKAQNPSCALGYQPGILEVYKLYMLSDINGTSYPFRPLCLSFQPLNLLNEKEMSRVPKGHTSLLLFSSLHTVPQ